ncbi:MAG: NAD(P)/FAD-dependent oxidoreductase [Vicinamibacterales bacterium]
MTPEDVLVIGAGPAGLATSASLRQAGIPHLVVDRAGDVAASWKQHYDRLHLHTVKQYSSLPFAPWPDETPLYPSRSDVVRYLERYAEQHRITPRFGVEVRRVSRGAARFTVETSAGRLEPRFVIVATGYNGVANRPAFPGLGGFAGTVVHTETYKNPQLFVGRRTLVVGCGNSGAEIALDLAEHGIDVAMVVRGPVHVVPRDLFGRPSQVTSVMLSRLPVAVRDAVVSPILRLAVGDLSRWGITRPALGPNRLIEDTGRIPMLDIGTIAQVKAGRIRVRPAVQEVLPDRVCFEDGRTEAFDAIVLATGYRPGLDRFIDGFASISDQRGRPHRFGEETSVPGLFFVGFRNPSTGALREIAREAPRVAAAIRRNQ